MRDVARSRRVVVLALLAMTAVGCSGAGSAPPPTAAEPRVLQLTTTDEMRFEPDTVVVRAGETIRFVVSNPGSVIHDLTVGDLATQDRREQQLRTFFGAGGGGDMPDHGSAVLVDPGSTSELLVTFRANGELLMGCHIPGHWDARMRGTIQIVP